MTHLPVSATVGSSLAVRTRIQRGSGEPRPSTQRLAPDRRPSVLRRPKTTRRPKTSTWRSRVPRPASSALGARPHSLRASRLGTVPDRRTLLWAHHPSTSTTARVGPCRCLGIGPRARFPGPPSASMPELCGQHLPGDGADHADGRFQAEAVSAKRTVRMPSSASRKRNRCGLRPRALARQAVEAEDATRHHPLPSIRQWTLRRLWKLLAC